MTDPSIGLAKTFLGAFSVLTYVVTIPSTKGRRHMSDPKSYGRSIHATFPPLLVRRLDHWILERDKWRPRSSVIVEAVAFFLDHQEGDGIAAQDESKNADADS